MRSIFFDITMVLYFISVVVYFLWLLAERKRVWAILGSFILVASLHSGGGFIIQRWLQAGHPPFTTTFEVMFFLSWSIVFVYLLFERFYDIRYAGAFISLLALIVIGYATFFESRIHPILPALQNNFWLTIHVIFCFIGYAGFCISYVVTLLHLLGEPGKHRKFAAYIASLSVSSLGLTAAIILLHQTKTLQLKLDLGTVIVVLVTNLVLAGILLMLVSPLLTKYKIWERLSEKKELDTLIYKTITFGFPFLGIGIITGAVWANEAWGTYWSWDPKETWSLITWLIYFLYLHLRFVRGWRGARLSWFSVIGFLAMIFTFFGVNYLLSGLHSYL